VSGEQGGNDFTWPDGRLFRNIEVTEVNAYNRPAVALTTEMLERALQAVGHCGPRPWGSADRPRVTEPNEGEPVPLTEDEDRTAWVDGIEAKLTAAIRAIRRGETFNWDGPADQMTIRIVPWPLGWR
jgi:hypothetical protein